jgi:hypothetical protein
MDNIAQFQAGSRNRRVYSLPDFWEEGFFAFRAAPRCASAAIFWCINSSAVGSGGGSLLTS